MDSVAVPSRALRRSAVPPRRSPAELALGDTPRPVPGEPSPKGARLRRSGLATRVLELNFQPIKESMGSDAQERHGNSPPRGAERGFPGWSPTAGEEQRPVQGRARKEVGTRAATTVSGRVQTPECPGNGEGGKEDFR